jgi:predicted Zn-dependent protease
MKGSSDLLRSLNLRPISFVVLLAFFTGITVGLSGNGAQALTISEERELGEKLLSIVRAEFDLLDEPDLTQYITRLGREILKETGSSYFDYHFFVVKDKEINAFAAPSGLIFFNAGLIEAMSNENELVSVMAHEAGHIVSRHYADRLKKSTKTSIATAALILAGIAMGGGAVSEALITGAMATNATLSLKFSRADEEEADRLAYRWMKAQGRDPADMVDMLRTLRKINLYRGANIPPYLLTHPEPHTRMGYVQDLLLYSKNGEYRAIDEFEFKRFQYRILSQSKDPQTLIPLFKKNIAAADAEHQAAVMEYYGLALALQAAADYDAAEKALQTVIDHYPEESILKTDLGVIFFESGRYSEALKIFNQAWAMDRNCNYTTYYLGRTLEQTGSLDRAIELYGELQAQQPDYADLYYRLGKIWAAKGNKGVGYYYLGVNHWYQGDAQSAKWNLNQALSELEADDPFHAKAQAMLAKIERLESIR